MKGHKIAFYIVNGWSLRVAVEERHIFLRPLWPTGSLTFIKIQNALIAAQ